MVDTDRLAKDLRKHLASLQEQRDKLDSDIGRLETALAALGVKRGPGRPKGSKNKGAVARRKPNWSPDKRREVSERMKKYWADRRKKAGRKTKAKAQPKAQAKAQ
jgi:hypothetical protein